MAARRRLVLSIVAFVYGLAFAAVPAHAAAILLVNSNGILTGATNVNVGGKLYNVEFVDGTCIDVFDGCDALTDFAFTTQSDARAASQALLDQVFIDVGQGSFDSTPSLTLGCSNQFACVANTPYGLDLIDSVFVALARNEFSFDEVDSASGLGGGPIDLSTADFASQVYARWTATSDVPEPASLTLLGLGLAGIGTRRWRHRKTT